MIKLLGLPIRTASTRLRFCVQIHYINTGERMQRFIFLLLFPETKLERGEKAVGGFI